MLLVNAQLFSWSTWSRKSFPFINRV